MGHLKDPGLHKYRAGSTFSAEVLNHDFNALRELAETAAGLALQPDLKALEALRRVAAAEARLGALEAPKREPPPREQMTPLSSFGESLRQVSELRDRVAVVEALRTDVTRYRTLERQLESRMGRIEVSLRPLATMPTRAEFDALQAELAAAKEETTNYRYQVQRLRTDVAQLRADIDQRDKAVAEAQSAAHAVMQQQVDAMVASTAAEEVVQMRAELAAMKRLIEDSDRRESLQRFFVPRSMAAHMLQRLERLEARK